MAIDDFIWAKNRHMFGGIEPDAAEYFLVEVVSRRDDIGLRLNVHVVVPGDTVVDEQTLCTTAGVVIRGSFTEYPTDEFSGFLIADCKESGTYNRITIAATGTEEILYVSAFSYSDQGVFNRSGLRKAIKITEKGDLFTDSYVFGFDIDLDNPDPEDRVIYPADVDNYLYERPADKSYLNDWDILPGEKFMPRPCYLNYDGKVDGYMDDAPSTKITELVDNGREYTLNVDGLSAWGYGHVYKPSDSYDYDIYNLNYPGNIMVEWPKIYIKRWEEDGIYHFRCSDIKQDDDYECYCNYNEKGVEIDHFYTGVYKAVTSSGKYRSISLEYLPDPSADNPHHSVEEPLAEANGPGWGIMHVSEYLLIQDLLVMMGKTTNLESVFGYNEYKDCTENIEYFDSSLACVFGLHSYKDPDPQRVAGLWWEDLGKGKSKFLMVNRAPTAKPSIDSLDVFTTIASGYISEMNTTSYGRIPGKKGGGSSSTYECSLVSLSGEDTNPSTDEYETQALGLTDWFGFKTCAGGCKTITRLSYRPIEV